MNDTDMCMDFSNALRGLEFGHDMRRKQWLSGIAIRMVGDDKPYTVKIIDGNREDETYGFIWSDEDIYATDWEIA